MSRRLAGRRRSRRAHLVLAALGAVMALAGAGCTADEPAETGSQVTGEPTRLDVLVYNVEYSGDRTTDAVIRSLDADVVGILESYNRLPQIADNTGYPYYSVGLQLLSKYPILEPSGADGRYAFIEVQPGFVVAFFNAHLDYVRYGPTLLSAGVPLDEVLESEDIVRTASIQHLVPDLDRLAGAGFPVFLTGDFNQPSSLDYTEETVGTRPWITEAIPWPVSEALLDIGLRDTYREIHPDPVETPGNTYDYAGTRTRGPGDRIDYVYAGGPGTTLDSRLVGETGGPDVDLAFDPWTSDHRAVLSTVEVTPVALPTTVSLDRRMLTDGEHLTVYAHAPGHDEPSLAVLPQGGSVGSPLMSLAADASGTARLDTGQLDPGGYEIALLDEDGGELARNAFWVRSKVASVQIQTDRTEYPAGEPIEITWDQGPANRWDWIGVYRAGAANPEDDDYLLWGYTGGHDSGVLPPSVSGSMTLDGSSQGRPWPLPPGDYVAHYLLTDQYTSAGSVEFTVTP